MEFMASLQGGLDEQKPSLFELLSEQQLSALLPPSLRYLLAVATHRNPRYLLRILNSFDEVYAVLMLLVERHYLQVYRGGFTENFYGLKRERVLKVRGGEIPRAQIGAAGIVRETLELRKSDIWKSLAVMVGIPYLKRKFDESYDIYVPQSTILGPNFNRDSLPTEPTPRQRLLYYYKWFLRKIYPSVNAAYYFSILAFNLAYLFDSSKYHSPFLWLIGTRMRRLGEADYRAIALATEPIPIPDAPAGRPGQATSLLNPRMLGQVIYPRLLSSLKILLPTSIFALKFLEWWHASDFARQLSRKAAEGIELPPPVISGLDDRPRETTDSEKPRNSPAATSDSNPKPSNSSSKNPPISKTTSLPILVVPLPPPKTSDLCPICTNSIITPTASSSGYVFCYTCIHKWVEGNHDRQLAFMEGGVGEEGWGEEFNDGGSRVGKWESGQGRCAVSGRRILGGTEGLRRVMV